MDSEQKGAPTSRSGLGLHPSEAECIGAILCFVLTAAKLFEDPLGFSLGAAPVTIVVLAAGAIAIAWVVRLLISLLIRSRTRSAFANHKVAWLLAPALAAVVGLLSLTQGEGPISFDSQRWLATPVGGKQIIRWRMVDDLRDAHLKEGRPTESVLALLGPPKIRSGGGSSMRWWLKRSRTREATWWLEVRFEDGRLKHTSVQLD